MSAKYRVNRSTLFMMSGQGKFEIPIQLERRGLRVYSKRPMVSKNASRLSSHPGEGGLNRKVVFNNQMSSECRPYAVVIQSRFPIMGIKF